MQLLKSFFRKSGQTKEVNLDLNDLKGFLDIGGLSYIKEIEATSDTLVSKVKKLLASEDEIYNLKSAKVAIVHFYSRPIFDFEAVEKTMEAINDFLGDNVKDVYFGTNSHPRYTKDMITCGIMLGGIKQRK